MFGAGGRYLDVAGGTGMLVRLMRDAGFDFYWHDPYCLNIHARGFEFDCADSPFLAATAFEVLEHTEEPLAFVKDTLSMAQTDTLIFSTELYGDGAPPAPGEWWYYAFETGQHICFFQRRTLENIAERLGLRLYSHLACHMLTKKRISPLTFRLSFSRFGGIAESFMKYKIRSKTMDDHNLIVQRLEAESFGLKND